MAGTAELRWFDDDDALLAEIQLACATEQQPSARSLARAAASWQRLDADLAGLQSESGAARLWG